MDVFFKGDLRVSSAGEFESRHFVQVLMERLSKTTRSAVIYRLDWCSGMSIKKNGQRVKNKGGLKAGHTVYLGIRGKRTLGTKVRNGLKRKKTKIFKTKIGV